MHQKIITLLAAVWQDALIITACATVQFANYLQLFSMQFDAKLIDVMLVSDTTKITKYHTYIFTIMRYFAF